MQTDEEKTNLHTQEFLDDILKLNLSYTYSQWYNVDVASLISNTNILGHEIDETTGSALIFLDRSVMFCCPKSGKIHHYPKHLLHCFVDDKRGQLNADDTLFRAELFSISPKDEQLCWEKCCNSELDIPNLQSKVSNWIGWLNK